MIFIKKLIIIILLLLPIWLSSFKWRETTFFNSKEEVKEEKKQVTVHLKDKDIYLDLEEYVVGVVAAEMPASFTLEALKAQAVASRSYAMSKVANNMIEITSTINDQVFQTDEELKNKWKDSYEKYYNKILSAVNDTEGEIVSRDGKILKTYYFSMSNGKTENSQTVFNDPMFLSVDSPYENSNLKNFEVVKEFSENEMLNLLGLNYINVQNVTKNDTDHVDNIVISNKKFKGTEFRKLLNLRSTDFKIEKDGDKYLITTRGYGHGVGMSQYGANEMAKNGYNYKDIIYHYYQNVEMVKI